MGNPQADADPVIGLSVELVGRHEKPGKNRGASSKLRPRNRCAMENPCTYFLEPSVEQPPLPLQECFSTVDFLLEALPVDFWLLSAGLMPLVGAATSRVMVPPIRPAKAAPANKELFETFMVFPLLVLEWLPNSPAPECGRRIWKIYW